VSDTILIKCDNWNCNFAYFRCWRRPVIFIFSTNCIYLHRVGKKESTVFLNNLTNLNLFSQSVAHIILMIRFIKNI